MSGRSARRPAPARVALALAVALLSAGCAAGGDRSGDGAARGAPDGHAASLAGIAPQQLVGLDADQLGHLLGPADFRREDGPVEIWQYRATGCVLDLYLYADAASATRRVAHTAARDISPAAPSDPACVAGLLQSRHARAAGQAGLRVGGASVFAS